MILTPDYENIVVRINGSRQIRAEWGNDGDFITPEGKVIHTGENHTIFMMDNPEMFGDNREPDDMVYQGWIRTRTIFGTFSVDARGGMNERQLRVIQKMVQERCRYSEPRIEVQMDDENLYTLECSDFDEIEYPNQIKRRGLRSSRLVGERVTDYTDWQREDDPEGEHPYFGVGHGGFSEEHGHSPEYVVWVISGGQLKTSRLIGPDDEEGFGWGGATHGSLWGHGVIGHDYKGRYEPETGRLTIVKPERQRMREIPDMVWTKLRSKFKNIDEVRVF